MQAGGEERYWPAVGIVRRVHHVLIIERQHHAVDHVHGVERLDNALRAIVGPAVADQDPEAAGGEVGAVIPRQPVDGTGKSDPVVGASPTYPFDRGAQGETVVDVGEGGDLVLAVVPAPAGEHANVVADRLLQVEIRSEEPTSELQSHS